MFANHKIQLITFETIKTDALEMLRMLVVIYLIGICIREFIFLQKCTVQNLIDLPRNP